MGRVPCLGWALAGRCRGYRQVLVFAALLVPLLIVGAALPAKSGAAPSGPSAPDFAGTAQPITPASRCPAALPQTMVDPFGPNAQGFAAADYRIDGCWEGTLTGKPFVLDLYGSRLGGGGVAIIYVGQLVAHVLAGSNAPSVIRFTDDDACWVTQAGAFYGAVNVRTGAAMPDQQAQRVCPPPSYPPTYVLGLGAATYPFSMPVPSPMAASTSAPLASVRQLPRTLPKSGGGGANPAASMTPRMRDLATVIMCK